MAVYPIAYLVTAPLIGAKMKYIGRKNTVLIGVIIITLSTLMFGLGGYSTNVYVFYGISIIARLIQGVAESMMNVAIYSIVPIEYPANQELYLGWIAMAEGMACALGPLLGSVVYGWLGYVGTFYFFTAYIAFFGFTSVLMIPGRVNTTVDADEDGEGEADGAEIGYSDILLNRKSIAALIACIMGMICCAFIDPTLSVRLEEMQIP